MGMDPKVLSQVPPELKGLLDQVATTMQGNMQFSGFDHPTWPGAFGAPMTNSQTNALQRFEFLNQLGPAATNQDLAQQLAQAASGDPAFDPQKGFSLQQSVDPFRFNTQATDQLSQFISGNNFGPGPQQSNLGEAADLTRQTVGNAPQLDFGATQGAIDRLLGDVQNTQGNQSQQFFNQLFGGSGVGGQTQRALGNAGGAFGQALSAPSFDQSQMFSDMDRLFQSDLDRIIADTRAEYSNLGLGPGSTDRDTRIVDRAGDAAAKFRVGQGQLAQQSFEDAQGRQLQALGLTPGLTNAFETGTRQQLSALPALMGAESRPFQEQLAERSQQAQILPTLFQTEYAPGQLGLAQQGLGLQAAGQLGQFAQVPFQEQLAAATQIGLPRAQMQLGATQLGLGQDQQAFQNMFNVHEAGANRQLAALPHVQQAVNNGFNQQIQQFGLGSAVQQQQNQALMNQYNEFVRSQGGQLNQLIGLLGGTPPPAYGPSDMSQVGGVIGGLGSLIGSLLGGFG